jgi:prepilin-type N-terminal cleavage/methylation domain-containing protein
VKLSIQKRHFESQAFTMIELMLAIGIFGLVMIAIYSSWSAILRGTRSGLTAAAEVQRTRVAVRALEESVSAAVMYADNAKYYAFMSDTGGEFAYLSFVSRLPESFPGSGLFRGQPIRRLTFFVDEQRNLMLTQHALLDMSEQPYSIKLAPNVRTFAMEFWNPRMGEWLPEWMSTNALPSMMRVAINFGAKDQDQGEVTIRSIPLNAMAITRVGGNPQRGAPNQPGPGGAGQFGGEEFQWNLRLPPNFGANNGTVPPNPVFPRNL